MFASGGYFTLDGVRMIAVVDGFRIGVSVKNAGGLKHSTNRVDRHLVFGVRSRFLGVLRGVSA